MPDNLSFIPKTSFLQNNGFSLKRVGFGLVFKISVVLFFLSLLFYGGALLYKNIVARQVDDLSVSLERAKAVFDLQFILEMEQLSQKIPVAKDLAAKHRFTSNLFLLLEDLVCPEVRFLSMDYSYIPPQTNPLAISLGNASGLESLAKAVLTGESKSYTALAQQANIFKTSTKIKSFIFSNFTLTQEGNVSFSLEIILNPEILYVQKYN